MEYLEKKLCGELAASIARCSLNYLSMEKIDSGKDKKPDKPIKGAKFYHESTTALEYATEILQKLNLITPVPSAAYPYETWYCDQMLVMDADDMPEYVTQSVQLDKSILQELLETFLRVASSQLGLLPSTREPFVASEQFTDVVNALAENGYIIRNGKYSIWTDNISPVMQRAKLWDQNFHDFKTIEEQEIYSEAKKALKAMPQEAKEFLFKEKQINTVEIASFVRTHWDGERWSPDEREHHLRINAYKAMKIAQLMISFSSNLPH